MDILLPFEKRREQLHKVMSERKLDGLLVYHAANRYYLSGFELHNPQCNESAGCLIILANGKDWLCTDSRYTEAAKRLWDEDFIYSYGHNIPEQLGLLINKILPKGSCIGFESKVLSVNFFEAFVEQLQDITPVSADGIVEDLRVIKDEQEVRLMEQSCLLNHQLLTWVPSILRPGESEASVSWEIELFFRKHGANELAFPSIVASGGNAALPHAIPSSDTQIESEELVLVDVGARLYDYCSDQTRTFWVGDNPSKRFQQTLALIQEAQHRAIKAIQPGVLAKDVYNTVYTFFIEYGVEKAFKHNLGHGVGLEVHEAPSLGPRSETILKPGMVITVEPGLYYPEWGGVRWEHMVLVTEDGAKVF
ncbi:M24 family metallopeptidase [Lawsonia intracellularis]|uniref:M24 family metallopeptidase n=1 Tax=Lawsonia intracellularis TaxID=29546 RepID=UPI0011EFE07B|nr:Xaa-Pro peptidase family protein [Lawsonia intracellularis]KAA0204269.1 peptidase M24 family protein [Lawsonia intracellularis]